MVYPEVRMESPDREAPLCTKSPLQQHSFGLKSWEWCTSPQDLTSNSIHDLDVVECPQFFIVSDFNPTMDTTIISCYNFTKGIFVTQSSLLGWLGWLGDEVSTPQHKTILKMLNGRKEITVTSSPGAIVWTTLSHSYSNS